MASKSAIPIVLTIPLQDNSVLIYGGAVLATPLKFLTLFHAISIVMTTVCVSSFVVYTFVYDLIKKKLFQGLFLWKGLFYRFSALPPPPVFGNRYYRYFEFSIVSKDSPRCNVSFICLIILSPCMYVSTVAPVFVVLKTKGWRVSIRTPVQ